MLGNDGFRSKNAQRDVVAEVNILDYLLQMPPKEGCVPFFGACWAYPYVRCGYLRDTRGDGVLESWPAPSEARETFGVGEACLALCHSLSGHFSIFVSLEGDSFVTTYTWSDDSLVKKEAISLVRGVRQARIVADKSSLSEAYFARILGSFHARNWSEADLGAIDTVQQMLRSKTWQKSIPSR